ncbi:hypothetical protein BH23ACT3_BH23ACT3_24390 [soil metagenome]
MKKFLIGATTALTALALVGGSASAQEGGAYTPPGALTVAGSSTCTAVSDGPPRLDYNVTYNESFDNATLTLSFERPGGASFGKSVVVQNPAGVITFPTNGNGSNGGYVADGWSIQAGQWLDGVDKLVVVATLVGTDGSITAKAPITYDFEGCLASAPPVTTVPGATPPIPRPPTALPIAPIPPQQRPPLPSTGLSTFESGMRIGALLLIGGLGFVIVAKRRRFAAVTSASA